MKIHFCKRYLHVIAILDGKNYPKERITDALQSKENLQKYFGTVVEPSTELVSRFHEISDNLCKTNTETTVPQVGVNKDGIYRFIVQLAGNFTQTISYEECDK